MPIEKSEITPGALVLVPRNFKERRTGVSPKPHMFPSPRGNVPGYEEREVLAMFTLLQATRVVYRSRFRVMDEDDEHIGSWTQPKMITANAFVRAAARVSGRTSQRPVRLIKAAPPQEPAAIAA